MQAIETKYMGPTNFKGSRVKAVCAAGSLTIEWDDTLNSDENHLEAARKLAEKLRWLDGGFSLRSGTLKNGHGVHVLVYSASEDQTCITF